MILLRNAIEHRFAKAPEAETKELTETKWSGGDFIFVWTIVLEIAWISYAEV
jgi:hypothetical protein